MKFLKKLNHYIKYLIGLFLQNPKLVYMEFLEDYKKDKQAFILKKKHNLVWICSLPKSGSTLVEEILNFYPYVKLDRSLKRFYFKGNLSHAHDISYDMFASAPNDKLSFIKTHTHFNDTVIDIYNKFEPKIIFTFRDLRDVLISRYYHILADSTHRHHKIISKMPQKEGFICSFENNELNKDYPVIDYYYNWIKNWKTKKDSINHLELWYEDYVTNPDYFLNKIVNFIGENPDELGLLKDFIKKEEIRKKQTSLQNLIKDKSKKVSTFRSGKINNWKSFFDNEITKKFNDNLPGPLENILKK